MGISVIVPLYYGARYINNMLLQIEKAASNCKERVQLVFVNDCPEEDIPNVINSEILDITIIGTDTNRGIHGARVLGLEYAKGEFILFLDQDDKIDPMYFEKQLLYLHRADAVVCAALNGNRIVYGLNLELMEAKKLDFMIGQGNAIVSPGQVLIRKSAIPDLWKANIMKCNGSDDWLLWIIMLKKGAIFEINEEILFFHTENGENTSADLFQLSYSDCEVKMLLHNLNVLTIEEQKLLEKTVERVFLRRIEDTNYLKKKMNLLRKWLTKKQENRFPIIERKDIKIAIYGCTELGKSLVLELKLQAILPVCFLDVRMIGFFEGIPIVNPNDGIPDVDLVIVTLVKNVEEVNRFLVERCDADIRLLSDYL